jgi:hypothetical protein
MTCVLARLATRARLRWAHARYVVTLLAVAALLTACDGDSGQSGSAFVFLTVDRFSLNGTTPTASVTSSTNPGTTTSACVTLRNNLKNPTITAPSALDNVTVQSYTVTLNGGASPGPFTFGTGVLVPAGTVTMGTVSGNTATFGVVLVPTGAKSSSGTVVTAEITFRGRDGRGLSVETEGAVTVVFETGATDSVCSAT